MQKSLLFLFLLFFSSLLSAQSKIQISRPDLSYINNTLTVKYDITGCKTGQFVHISMIVVNSKGDTIRPTYINGDIGNKITCGPGKSILWDVARDTINLDDDIEVMLTGKEIIPVITKISNPDLQKVSRGTVLISSFFIPGLGQKKLQERQAIWYSADWFTDWEELQHTFICSIKNIIRIIRMPPGLLLMIFSVNQKKTSTCLSICFMEQLVHGLPIWYGQRLYQ